MGWQEFFTKEIMPTNEQIEKYINNTLWEKLNDYLKQAYDTEPKMDYSACSMQAGWNIKYKKSGKSLCTLYPMNGYFIALIVIGRKEMSEAEFLIPSCSEYVQSVFKSAVTGQGQKWLMIDVKNENTVQDIVKLISLKVKTKKQQCII